MKKQILFFAVAALALASCSSENDVVQSPDVQQTADDGAVGFDVYTQRATTRAGEIGTLTTEKLKNGSFKDDGFGVFGYYTNSATYDQQAIPNFFYNQQVTWNGSYFQYEPIKYWPNEYGTTAESEDADKVSFFAYAPYVLVNPSTGKAVNALEPAFDQEKSAELQKWGISSLSRNSATGDPLVKYIASFDQDKCVDLCWGVCDQTTWPRVLDGRAQEINSGKTGLPWLDVERPAEAKTQDKAKQRVKFTFKHATSQLIVKIDAFVDGIDNTNAINNTETRVYVRSINFEGFAMKGALNLNNFEAGQNKAYWLDFAGTNDLVTGESITIYDGRKDGKEGTPSGVATNEKSLGLNPALIQSDTWANHTTDGVTNVEQYLFRKQTGFPPDDITYASADGPIYVIPTGDDVKVTIVYDIETADKNLATYVSDATVHGSSIENCITKTINFGNTAGMENGKAYTIKLHLGMNSVKFDADVTDWVEADAIPEVDLPANVPQFKSLASGATDKYTVELPATTTEYTFAITELNGGEAVTAPSVSGNFTPGTANGANGSGVAIESVTIAQNMTPNDMAPVDLTWTGASSGRVANMSFIQKAHALELSVTSVSIKNKEIVLDAGATGIVWGTDVATPSNTDDDAIKVWRNGARLTYESSATNDGEFSWDAGNKKITLGAAPVPGETYNIYVKAGDAEGETVTVHIGGPVLSNAAVSLEYGETYTRLPKFYGSASVLPEYTWSSSAEGTATVANGVVTTVAYNASPAKIKLATTAIAPANGWVYDTSDKEYEVTVTKATGKISFENAEPAAITGQTKTAGSTVFTNLAVLRNSKKTVLEQGDTKGGKVSYSIESVEMDGSAVASTTFDVTDGVLKVGTTHLSALRTYVIVVKATVTGNANAGYTEDTATYTISVKTGS